MEKFFISLTGFFLTIYITAIILFKQHFNTYTYYIDILFFVSMFLLILLRKDYFIKINSLIYAYGLFFLFSLISSMYGVDFDTSSTRSLQLFLIVVNIFFIYNVLKKFHLYNAFLNGILLGSFINYLLLLGLVNAPFDIIFPGGGDRFMGTSGNPNVLAVIMIISILSSIIYLRSNINKYFMYYQYINILLAIYTIMATVSKKGIIFGFLLLLIYLLITLKNPKLFFKMILGMTISLVIAFQFIDISSISTMIDLNIQRFTAFETQLSSSSSSSGGSTAQRAYMIKTAWNVFQDSPIFGNGIATFMFFNDLGTYAHNNYLELLSSVGIIGAALFYSIYYFVIKNIIKMKDTELKIILIFFIIILLVMDIAVVSYGSKYLIYTLVFIIAYAEENKNISLNSYKKKDNQ